MTKGVFYICCPVCPILTVVRDNMLDATRARSTSVATIDEQYVVIPYAGLVHADIEMQGHQYQSTHLKALLHSK